MYEKGSTPSSYNINNVPISYIKHDSIYNGSLSQYVNNSSYDKKILSSSYIKDNESHVNKMNIEKSTIWYCSTNELPNDTIKKDSVHKKESLSQEFPVNNNDDVLDIKNDEQSKCAYNNSVVDEKENNNINVGEFKIISPNNLDSNNISSTKHITVRDTYNDNINKTKEAYILIKKDVNNAKCDNIFELSKMNEHSENGNNSKHTNSDIEINDRAKNLNDFVSMHEMNNFNKVDDTQLYKKKISELSNNNEKCCNINEDKNKENKNIHMHVIKEDRS